MAAKPTKFWFMVNIGGAWHAATIVKRDGMVLVVNAAGDLTPELRPTLEGVADPHHQIVASMNAVRGASLRSGYDAGNLIPDDEIKSGFRAGTHHHVTLADFLCNGPQTTSTQEGMDLLVGLELVYGQN